MMGVRRLLAVSFVVLALVGTVWNGETGMAQTDRVWRQAGFGTAGNFTGVYFDPKQPGVVYATSDVAGVMYSADNGDHWEVRSVGLGNYQVASFAIDPFDSNTLYAGAGALAESNRAGIYVSHNAGLTWNQLENTAANQITFRRFRTFNAIAPDPAHQGVLLSGSRSTGIWRTTDTGMSWTQVYAAPIINTPPIYVMDFGDDPAAATTPAPVSVVFFDPSDPNLVYAGFNGAGIVRSADGGLAWEPVNSGLPDEAGVKYLAVARDGVIYAALGESGVYKSTDRGDSWQPINDTLQALLPGSPISSVIVHPDDSNIAYLTVVSYDYPSVWWTTDGGVTWTPRWSEDTVIPDAVNEPSWNWQSGLSPNLSWMAAFDPFDPQQIIYVNFWTIFRSQDGGAHWTEIAAGAQNTCVNTVLVDTDHAPGEPDVWYATHWDAGLLSSKDQGATWQRLLPPVSTDWWGEVEPLSGHYWGLVVVRVGETKYFYVASDPWNVDYGSKLLRSTDGVHWTTIFNPPRPKGTWLGGAMLGLAVDPTQPSILYVTQDGGQVFKSTDNGNTWAPTPTQPGNSFTYALVVDDAGRVYVGTLMEGLWRSTDGGDSWQRVLPDQATFFQALAVPGTVYAAAGDANLYRTTDGGDTWQRLTDFVWEDDGDGVGEEGYAIAVDPNDPNHLFFSLRDAWHSADAASGVFESLDGGVTWTPINSGLGQLNVSTLAVAPDGGVIAGTSCAGIWYLPAP